jgi:SAM-dependent methyltransferase
LSSFVDVDQNQRTGNHEYSCVNPNQDKTVIEDGGRKGHWETVYQRKTFAETSWHQPVPQPSLSMITGAGLERNTPILDIGGGASLLADHLIELGYIDLTILDVSGAALKQASLRLGEDARAVHWVETDVTQFKPGRSYGLWHDRAAFHFLTDDNDRKAYLEVLNRALAVQGQVIIATFSPQGPRKCSGLDVVQYDREKMEGVLGPDFILLEQQKDQHVTPGGSEQWFNYFRFQKIA